MKTALLLLAGLGLLLTPSALAFDLPSADTAALCLGPTDVGTVPEDYYCYVMAGGPGVVCADSWHYSGFGDTSYGYKCVGGRGVVCTGNGETYSDGQWQDEWSCIGSTEGDTVCATRSNSSSSDDPDGDPQHVACLDATDLSGLA